jgi:hypothetical protein
VAALAPEYQVTDNFVVEGAGGLFWTAGAPTRCPAVLRSATAGACGGPLNSGGSSFLGWEVAAGVRYTIMPGLTWTPRFAFANYSDAFSANNRTAQPAFFFANRLIYVF